MATVTHLIWRVPHCLKCSSKEITPSGSAIFYLHVLVKNTPHLHLKIQKLKVAFQLKKQFVVTVKTNLKKIFIPKLEHDAKVLLGEKSGGGSREINTGAICRASTWSAQPWICHPDVNPYQNLRAKSEAPVNTIQIQTLRMLYPKKKTRKGHRTNCGETSLLS